MPVERFDRALLASVPWKNGGGVTREIVCRPAGAGLDTFDWRVSVATIDSDGPFSVFAGIDRVIMLLESGGVQLRSKGGEIDRRLDAPLTPFAFDGGAEIACTRLAGSSTDFNIMTRRATCAADVQVLREGQTLQPSAGGVLLIVHGTWRAQALSHRVEISSKVSDPLRPDTGVWWDDVPLGWQLEPRSDDAALIAVQIAPRADRRAA